MSSSSAALEALRRLDKACDARPELHLLRQVTSKMIRALFLADPLPFEPNRQFGSLESDASIEPVLKKNWRALCHILAETGSSGEPSKLESALASADFRLIELLRNACQSQLHATSMRLTELDLPSEIGLTLLRLSGLPILDRMTLPAMAIHSAEASTACHCARCGNLPLLGEIRGLERIKWLRCGWCAAQWQVDRIYCPFCGCRDHRRLRDIFVDGKGDKEFACICENCGGWVLYLSSLYPISTPGLLVAEVELMPIRLLAEKIAMNPKLEE